MVIINSAIIRIFAKFIKAGNQTMESIKEMVYEFQENEIFDKNQLREVVHNKNSCYSESSINWLIKEMKKDGQIASAGYGRYMRLPRHDGRRHYSYSHSRTYREIEQLITERYPLIDFQMWELAQFNEFINQQIASDVIVVEVEKMQEDAVFDTLRAKHACVLLSPDIDTFHRYRSNDTTIIVNRLISEAPKPIEGHSSPLEKLIVDIFSSKFTGRLIARSEYANILEDSFEKYIINESKFFRYARRRNIEGKIKEFIIQQGIKFNV